LKMIAIITTSLILIVIAALLILGLVSKSGEANGLVESRLSPCPDKPNCVCSEFGGSPQHYVQPVALAEAPTLEALVDIVRDEGGRIVSQQTDYVAATFSSALFGFVDDLELRVDRDNGLIHLRSESRVGRGDLGANRRRVDAIRLRLQETSGSG